MIRVTVELLPFGKEESRETLTTFDIANDGTGNSARGNYKIRKSPNHPWIEEAVKDYPRKQYNVRRLVYLALKAIEEKR